MKIFSLDVHPLRHTELIEELMIYVQKEDFQEKGKMLFTPNPEICLHARADSEYSELLQSAEYLTSDGMGLYMGYMIFDLMGKKNPAIPSVFYKIFAFFLFPWYIFSLLFRKKSLYKKYGDRICGSDLTESLLQLCAQKHIAIAIIDPFFPDDAKKVQSQKVFCDKLSQKFPGLMFDFYISTQENKADIFKKICNSQAKICFTTHGMKIQEQWARDVSFACKNIRLALGVGSSFDYYTGMQKRAPYIFRKLGLEWLYRICTSPKFFQRLKRVFTAVCVFPILCVLYKK